MAQRAHKACCTAVCIPQRERAEIAECLLELLAARSQLCHPAAAEQLGRAPRANGPTICKRSRNETRPTVFFFLFFFFHLFPLLFLRDIYFFLSFSPFPSKSTGCLPTDYARHYTPNFPRCSKFIVLDTMTSTVDRRSPRGNPFRSFENFFLLFFFESSRVVLAYGVARVALERGESNRLVCELVAAVL